MNVASAMSFVWDTKPDFPSSTSLKDSAQSNCAKRKRSRASVMVDDDYVPPIGDDENDVESSNSLIHKVQ